MRVVLEIENAVLGTLSLRGLFGECGDNLGKQHGGRGLRNGWCGACQQGKEGQSGVGMPLGALRREKVVQTCEGDKISWWSH